MRYGLKYSDARFFFHWKLKWSSISWWIPSLSVVLYWENTVLVIYQFVHKCRSIVQTNCGFKWISSEPNTIIIIAEKNVHVVVQFCPWLNILSFVFGYDNIKQRKMIIKPRLKLNNNIHMMTKKMSSVQGKP